SAALTAGMKKDAGTFSLSRSRRMRGNPSMAPYCPRDIGSEPGVPRARIAEALSTSKLNATATRAPLGHFFGLRRFPTDACWYCPFNSSRLSLSPGNALGEGGDWAELALMTANRQPAENGRFLT